MRSRVVSPVYKVKKNAESILHRMFPSRFIPLYSMVTFSRIPYAEAVKKARVQDALLEGLAGCAALGAAGLIAAGARALLNGGGARQAPPNTETVPGGC